MKKKCRAEFYEQKTPGADLNHEIMLSREVCVELQSDRAAGHSLEFSWLRARKRSSYCAPAVTLARVLLPLKSG